MTSQEHCIVAKKLHHTIVAKNMALNGL